MLLKFNMCEGESASVRVRERRIFMLTLLETLIKDFNLFHCKYAGNHVPWELDVLSGKFTANLLEFLLSVYTSIYIFLK